MKNGEVKINVANETMHVLKVDDLKKKVELLNLTVKGLCVNVTTVILNMPYLLSPVYEPPDAVKHDALLLLGNQSFIKWLK
ncbi:MAG: hypothetical protein ACUVQY_03235 [Thermoproteota archaeon]